MSVGLVQMSVCWMKSHLEALLEALPGWDGCEVLSLFLCGLSVWPSWWSQDRFFLKIELSYVDTYWAFDCETLVDITLAKVNHMTKSRLPVGNDCSSVCWEKWFTRDCHFCNHLPYHTYHCHFLTWLGKSAAWWQGWGLSFHTKARF